MSKRLMKKVHTLHLPRGREAFFGNIRSRVTIKNSRINVNALGLRGGRVWLIEEGLSEVRLQKGGLINMWLVISFSETKNKNRFGEKVRFCLGPIKSEVPTDFLGDCRWGGNRSVKCSDRQGP